MLEEEKREMPVPFGTRWYRTENVDIRNIKGECVLYYSGRIIPYEVGFATYRDFRRLALPVPNHQAPLDWVASPPRPADNVLEFFRKWGPLGFYYKEASSFVYDEVAQNLGLGSAFDVGLSRGMNEWESLEDYWTKHHTRKLRIGKTQTAFPEPDEVFDGYFERWRDAYLQLLGIQMWCLDWELEENLDDLNGRLTLTSLRPYIGQRNNRKGGRKYELTLAFSNLCDALVGLLAQNVIGAVDMRECKNCGVPFDAIETGRTTFCSNRCLVEYPDKQKREDPVIKYRRMLQRRLERRPEVSDKKSRAVNNELLTAKSVTALQAIEEKYPVILGKKKGAK